MECRCISCSNLNPVMSIVGNNIHYIAQLPCDIPKRLENSTQIFLLFSSVASAQLREIKGLCFSCASLSKALYQCLAEEKQKHANCLRTLHSSNTKTTLRSSDVRVKKSRMLSTAESFLTNMHMKLQLYVG